MATPTPSVRRSTRKTALPLPVIVSTSTPKPLSPFSELKRPALPPTEQNAFSSLKNSSTRLGLEMNQNVGFTKEQFEALCDKQRSDFKGDGITVDGLAGGLRSPSQVVEMFLSPRKEKNMELANEVNEWVEFLPYGDGSQTARSTFGGKENVALSLCKWILTTRSQDESGHWTYVDRQATREEILTFKEKGWPWYR